MYASMMMIMCSASVSNCMHKPICPHATFMCPQMMLKQPFLEPTVLHFTQHTYGAAIVKNKNKIKSLQVARNDAFRILL